MDRWPGRTRTYYQEWYARHDPVPYTGNRLWGRYVHTLHTLINSLDTPHPRGLEVGSGGGVLQHALERYVGVDLAASAARFVSQPFCAASAMQLPFADNVFDITWSIWTLEHVIEPEAMLGEMVRVTKPGGYLFLGVAWAVPDWATRGYHKGKWHTLNRKNPLAATILRGSVYPRKWLSWPFLYSVRAVQLLSGPRPDLSYRLLMPNYETYDETDADACISIDIASVVLWLAWQGVACVSHPTWKHILLARHDAPLIFRVATVSQ